MNREISIIVAITPNRVIGYKDEMPWYLPSDLKRFAKTTKGHSVIMGRKTYESIIKRLGRPLLGRTNIILTRQSDYQANGCIIVSSINEALEKSAEAEGKEEVFVIGGSKVYEPTLEYATKIYLTLVLSTHYKGDTFFPILKDKWLLEKSGESEKGEKDDCYSRLLIYTSSVARNKHINLNHSRTYKQTAVMEKIKEDGVCPFCMEHFLKYHTKPIIQDGKWWIMTENFEPYKGTDIHLIIVYKEHAITLSDISPEAFNELLALISWAEKHYEIDGGALFMRFGDTNRTGATVEHLHAQLIVGNSSLENIGEKLKVSLGYKNPE